MGILKNNFNKSEYINQLNDKKTYQQAVDSLELAIKRADIKDVIELKKLRTPPEIITERILFSKGRSALFANSLNILRSGFCLFMQSSNHGIINQKNKTATVD